VLLKSFHLNSNLKQTVLFKIVIVSFSIFFYQYLSRALVSLHSALNSTNKGKEKVAKG
jgi:hypothetical protein